ncbi:CDK5RAP1-like protein isoform X2 [Planococcus citri]|uniref:CDK5RAP1-like protein isoform X2 n=1 Tax=Planococcus citri TaxID=170843 RepID=UPI0031F86280
MYNLGSIMVLGVGLIMTQMTASRRLRHSAHSKSASTTVTAETPSLQDFIAKAAAELKEQEGDPDVSVANIPYLDNEALNGSNQKVFFEIYGCQMNVNDGDVVWSVLSQYGYKKTQNINEADVILLVTCSIRENAEARIWTRLNTLSKMKKDRLFVTCGQSKIKVGLLGCMAERLKERVLEKDRTVDIVAGPDSYKDLPRLLALSKSNQKAVNVQLSFDETYADVAPMRLNDDMVSSFVTIMRGCDNMCTYCIVPFTRGRERSRPLESIVEEVKILSERGIKEVTLLGQNVNSYRDTSKSDKNSTADDTSSLQIVEGFKTVYKPKKGGIRFAELLDKVSLVDPEMRIRFTSPHPKDFPDEVLYMIKERPNICKSIHLPAQSGNSVILEKMRRGYTRESYLNLVEKIRKIIPEVAFSGDLIMGFCGETEEQFLDTLSLVEKVRYNQLFTFSYSMREKTTAHRRYEDDVPLEVKNNRTHRVSLLFREIATQLNKQQIGKQHLVLVEGQSKKNESKLQGRNDNNIKVILPRYEIPDRIGSSNLREIKPGDYVCVEITESNSQNFRGIPLYHTSLQSFYASQQPGNDSVPDRNRSVI